MFQEIEELFNRALQFSFSRKNFFFIFPVLLGCGVLVVFCRAVSFAANSWVMMSLTFMPVFLCTGVLLAAGVLQSRMYYHEIKGQAFHLKKLLSNSVQLLTGVSYLALPLILAYLLLWTFMGAFHILKGIPGIGPFISILLSFGPFLLVAASLALSFASLLILFFVTPHVALKNSVHLHVIEEITARVRMSFFLNIVHFLIGVLPLLFCTGFLCLAAMMTDMQYLTATRALGISLEWFFIMVPFALMLTPSVIFFFNFATESYGLMQRKRKRTLEKEAEPCATP